jgi:hypothetical protein
MILESELRESVETAVRDNKEEIARKELGYAKKPCVPQLQ